MVAESAVSRKRAGGWVFLPVLVSVAAGCAEILGLEEGIQQGPCMSSAECAPGFECIMERCTACSDHGGGSACAALPGSPDASEPLAKDESTVMRDGGAHVGRDPGRDFGRGEACQQDGAYRCAVETPGIRLECRDGRWDLAPCPPAETCNSASDTCAPLVAACLGRQPDERFCEASRLFACGPDLVTTEQLPCDGTCAVASDGAVCVSASCGNGRLDEGEACDDGNENNRDDCTTLCEPATCGDGFVQGDEACDDGDSDNDDSCVENCQPASCGDGFVQAGVEACDDGNREDGDGCTAQCALAGCGDGQLGEEEVCDDGNRRAGDGCSALCRAEPIGMSLYGNQTCVWFQDGRAKCWGNNAFGQLGIGSAQRQGDDPDEMGAALPVIKLGSNRTAVSLGSGDFHTCAVLDDASLKCWGGNLLGQLGLGDTDTRGVDPDQMGDALPRVDLGAGRTVIAVNAGSGLTCALLDGGSLKCWGSNIVGELGIGASGLRGMRRSDMGDNLPVVDLGSDRTATQVAPGNAHVCALLDDGRVKCWGSNDYGELGIGDGGNRGLRASHMGDNLPAVDLGTGRTAQQIAIGYGHTCALLDDNHIKCWGKNDSGQLGLGDTRNRGLSADDLGDALPTVDIGPGRTARRLASGWDHVCALLDDGSVKCWGSNVNGMLGQGDTTDRGDEMGEMGDALPTVDLGSGRTAVSLEAGWRHTCALLDDGSLKCWGHNLHGQLGLGDASHRGDSEGEMGDALPAVSLW